jgi:2,3-dihydroxybiphenyl 1,2-dioxygenase
MTTSNNGPAHDLELGYLGIETADVPAFTMFLTDVVGLVPGVEANTWRTDDKAHRIILHDGPRNDAAYAGFEATSQDAFDATLGRLGTIGVDVIKGTDDEKDDRGVADLAWCIAPWGTRTEIALGLEVASSPFASPLVPGGFLTTHEGFGHVVFGVPDLDAADRFVTKGLGMSQSDWLENDMGGFTLKVRFYHCNARHHTVALAGLPFDAPTKLHHLMLEANDVDDVGTAFDRAYDARLPIASGLGKHPNDEMFSFYVVTPAGFQLEFGAGARKVTQPWSDNKRYSEMSGWGHQPVVYATTEQ